MAYEDQPLTGELLPADQEKIVRALEQVQRQGINAQVAARISRSVFFNRITKNRIQAATEVVQAEKGLMNELIGHQLTRARLLGIGVEIEAESFERQNRRDEARRKAELSQLDDQIAREERLQRLEQLKRNKEGYDETSRDKKYQREQEEAKQKAEHNTQMKILEATGKYVMKRKLRAECDRMIEEVTQGNRGQPTPEQEREIDDIRDYFQRVIDSL